MIIHDIVFIINKPTTPSFPAKRRAVLPTPSGNGGPNLGIDGDGHGDVVAVSGGGDEGQNVPRKLEGGRGTLRRGEDRGLHGGQDAAQNIQV